jgi:hypothetical protein
MEDSHLLGSCLCGFVAMSRAIPPNRRKCFCSNCGSQLFIRRLDKPEVTVVTLGTLDGDPHARPERHVFVASKAPWYEIADSLPQFKIYPGFEPTDDAFA